MIGLAAGAAARTDPPNRLYLLPAAWTEDGYRVTYELYREGKRERRASYEFNRQTLMWLPMVVVSWVNFFTTTEKEAFEATARKFLAEAYPEPI